MGPRRFSRGNWPPFCPHCGRLVVLQWGRGVSAAEIRVLRAGEGEPHGSFNGAAAFQPRKSEPEWPGVLLDSSLQWGRGVSAAEIRVPRRSRIWMGSRFNGAAAFQPRKWRAPCSCWAGQPGLQWGRGVSAAEIRRIDHVPSNTRGFNGAAAFQPRKYYRHIAQ